jgi:hypothetical protein
LNIRQAVKIFENTGSLSKNNIFKSAYYFIMRNSGHAVLKEPLYFLLLAFQYMHCMLDQAVLFKNPTVSIFIQCQLFQDCQV